MTQVSLPSSLWYTSKNHHNNKEQLRNSLKNPEKPSHEPTTTETAAKWPYSKRDNNNNKIQLRKKLTTTTTENHLSQQSKHGFYSDFYADELTD